MSTFEAREKLHTLQSALADFNAIWPRHARRIELYTIERDTNHQLGYHAAAFTVAIVPPDLAVVAAQAAFTDLHRAPNQANAGIARRYPGLIALDCDPLPLIAPVNEAKDALMALLDTLITSRNPVTRHRHYKALLGDVMVTHLDRHIHGIDVCPYRLTFTWLNKGKGTKRLDAGGAVPYLLDHYFGDEHTGYPNVNPLTKPLPPALVHSLPLPRRIRLQSDIEQLRQHRDTPLLFIKPVAPHPRLLSYAQPNAAPFPTFNASLPVFIHWPESTPFPRFAPLTSFAPLAPAEPSRRGPVSLLSHLNLYFAPQASKSPGQTNA